MSAGWKDTSRVCSNGLPYLPDYVICRGNVDLESILEGAEAARLLLKLDPPPDAIFCYNDPPAIGAMDAILDADLRIPEAIAVIGRGNLHYDILRCVSPFRASTSTAG